MDRKTDESEGPINDGKSNTDQKPWSRNGFDSFSVAQRPKSVLGHLVVEVSTWGVQALRYPNFFLGNGSR